jgi:hypothetical protein
MHEFYMITPYNLAGAIAASDQHVQSASWALRAAADTLKEIKRRGDTEDALGCICLDCPNKFSEQHRPIAFGVIVPMFPESSNVMIAHGICVDCFERPDLEAQIVNTLREMFPHGNFRRVETSVQ